MRLPARFVADNLIWTAGGMWAVWGVEPAAYSYLSTDDKLRVHGRIRAALLGLPSESMLLSVCARVDPAAVVERMVHGVDLAVQDAWREVCSRTLENLTEIHIHERRHYLAARLPAAGAASGLRALLAGAGAEVAERFGLPPARVHRRDVQAGARRAARIAAELSAHLELREVSAAEILWLYARAHRRGLDEPFPPAHWSPNVRANGAGPDAPMAGPALAALGDAVLKEGGLAEDPGRPRHRRYLRVQTEAGVAYQTFLAVADMPRRFAFPGGAGEWFAHADEAGFPVDWCARIRVVANQEAQTKARRQARALAAQVEEYDGEPSGVPQSLREAWEGVDDERAELGGNPADPELQATIVFCTWAEDLSVLEEQAAMLQRAYEPNEYTLPRPTGAQLELYRAMLPGAPAPAAARDYAQYLLPRDLAAGMPFAGAGPGDPTGMLLGVTLDGGTFRPVHYDPAHGVVANRSGAVGVCGALGSGKSYLAKTIAWATLARGGQVVALDRTASGEYASFAAVAPAESQVVRLAAGAGVCLDPLRVFAGEARVRYAIGFLTLLAGTSPTDLEGAVLAEAVREVAAASDARLLDVVGALEALGRTDGSADAVARRLRNFAASELASLAFGDGEPLSLDGGYTCFHAPGLQLPSKEVLSSELLSRQMLPEHVFSQALLYLVAAVAREAAFADASRFAAVLIDEAWALTSSVQGRQLLLECIRDGRKHNAGIWLLSQHPEDLGDDALADLLGTRFVFRQSPGAAPAALRLLGLEPQENLVRMLDGLAEGQCLMRDVAGRTGLVQVLAAPREELQEAFETNPAARATTASGQAPPAGDAELGSPDGEVART